MSLRGGFIPRAGLFAQWAWTQGGLILRSGLIVRGGWGYIQGCVVRMLELPL